VTATSLSLGGSGASNYMLGAATATDTADISALHITGDFTANNKIYDGGTTATVSSRFTVGDLGGVNLPRSCRSAFPGRQLHGHCRVGLERPTYVTHRNPFLFSVCSAVLALCGCGSNERKPGTTTERSGKVPVTHVKDDDPKMLAAMEKARSTLDEFLAALNSPKTSQSGFAVKMPIRDQKHVEHMWISPVRYGDGQFTGVINNEPLDVKSVKLGDEWKVAKSEISDWMYVDSGKLVGGYTIRVLRDAMPANKRTDFDRNTGLVID